MEAKTEPRALLAQYNRAVGRVEVELANGCGFSFPAKLVQGLCGASTEDLEDVEIELDGEGLRWPRLDADLLVPDLLRGVFGSKRWMQEVARTLGSSRSDAKANASRINGRKGGRPRKGS